MHTLMKAGLAVMVIGGGGVATHPIARAADPVPAAKAVGDIKIPATLEAHIRAIARAHAPAGGAAAHAEEHVMLLLQEHLAEVAKDPALTAQVRQVLAAIEAGDKDALAHVEQMILHTMRRGHH